MGPPNVDCSTTEFVTKCFVIFFVESDEDNKEKKRIFMGPPNLHFLMESRL